jgi:ribonuclease D
MNDEAELITTGEALERVAERLLKTDAVAVDTEFFWERTFYPVLGLVQLAADGGCWLIDTVSLRDLSALGPVLAAPSITKVLHDAPQDLGILARATGALPRTVFDTRLAAGFVGLGSTSSLQALLRQVLGIELAKAETRSDWLRRPLSASQLNYAADDVLHLLALRDALLSRCTDDTVRGWLAEELARLDDPALYGDRDPRRMFLRVKGGARLGARQLAVLRELADWRELEARGRDWPRAHVLPDDLLVALALRAPLERHALSDIEGWPRNIPGEVADKVLSAIAKGLACPESECPAASDDPDVATKRALRPKSDRLLAHLAAACAPHQVDPALAASRAEADAYVLGLANGDVSGHPLAQGWRKTLAKDFTL